MIVVSLTAHIVYFTVDQCASEMETPFGDDMNDIDIDKHIRRIDKHSAALLSIFAESPITNFDLFPEFLIFSLRKLAISKLCANLLDIVDFGSIDLEKHSGTCYQLVFEFFVSY